LFDSSTGTVGSQGVREFQGVEPLPFVLVTTSISSWAGYERLESRDRLSDVGESLKEQILHQGLFGRIVTEEQIGYALAAGLHGVR